MMYTASSREASPMEGGLEEFFNLSKHIRNRIDKAFDRAIAEASGAEPPRKRRKVAPSSSRSTPGKSNSKSGDDSGGGFMLPEEDGGGFMPADDDEGGGFMPVADDEEAAGDSMVDGPEQSSPSPSEPGHIPLSFIPRALQILDLPQDADILAVFRNAASGWSGGKDADEEDSVSRKDWRAVCAVLMEDPADTGMTGESTGQHFGSDMDEAQGLYEEEEIDGDDEDQYEESEGDDPSDEDDEEYGATPAKKKGRVTRSRGKIQEDIDESEPGIITLTRRQRQECQKAFALFFPDVPVQELSSHRLMIKDVANAFRTLKEKVTADEIVEMLEFFSSSADKSMSLGDFEQMMMRTHLV